MIAAQYSTSRIFRLYAITPDCLCAHALFLAGSVLRKKQPLTGLFFSLRGNSGRREAESGDESSLS